MIFDAFPESYFPIAPQHNKDYVTRLEVGEYNAKKSSVIICGLVRNAEPIFPYLRDRLEKIGSFFSEYQIFLYENDSTDLTSDLLNKWSKDNANFSFLSEKLSKVRHIQDHSLARRVDMAMYRNKYLDAIKNREADYVIIVDTDIEGGYSYEGILHSLSYDLDVIAANSVLFRVRDGQPERLYYDAWAFRKLGRKRKHKDEEINRMILNRGESPFEVNSAFGGLAIYRGSLLQNGKFRYTERDCDHCTLHQKLRESGYRVFLNPSLITLFSPTVYTRLIQNEK